MSFLSRCPALLCIHPAIHRIGQRVRGLCPFDAGQLLFQRSHIGVYEPSFLGFVYILIRAHVS